MNQHQVSDDKIEFPLFEEFRIESINHIHDSNPKIFDLGKGNFDFNELLQLINDFLNEQLSSEDLIFFPQEYLNMISFSPRADEVYENVKDHIIEFAQKNSNEIICLDSLQDIANKLNEIKKIVQNIFHYFNIFTVNQESFSKIFYSVFNTDFSGHPELIQKLHSAITDSFNNGNIEWFSIDCSHILMKTDLLDTKQIISNLNADFDTLEQLDLFFHICHSLIPLDQMCHFLHYVTEKIPDFSHFFAEVPQNWKHVSCLYEIYEYQDIVDDFISKFTELVKSQFTAFNPFQIFDEIHSLGSTNLMFIIRNIATTLFNGQNEMFSMLLANFIHSTFISLKQPISNDRLYLFDEFGQLSNGFFVRYHSHNLLKRLLNYKSVVFNADERFARICNHHHISAIIDDFQNKQKIVSQFTNISQIFTILVFNHEFFADQIKSKPKFPSFFPQIAKSFESYFMEHVKFSKLEWNFSLMQVKMKVLNIPGLKRVKCNGINAIILIKLSKKLKKTQASLKTEDLCKDLDLSEQEVGDAIEALSTFSLVKINEDKSISLNTDFSDKIDEQIVVPFVPRIAGVPNQTMVNTMQIESMITRYVKLNPGHSREDVYKQLSSFSNFTLTQQEFYNSLRSLIKKQIISPLDSSKSLKLTFP